MTELPCPTLLDGRADSPGHSVNFCIIYSVIELTHIVLDVQIIWFMPCKTYQSNEVGGRYHIEKEGLVRSVKKFQGNRKHFRGKAIQTGIDK